MVRLFNERMEQVACHVRLEPGKFSRALGVRGLHGTIKQSADYWHSRAAALGEAAGRWARRALDARGAEAIRSIMGLCDLAKKRRATDVNAACAGAMDSAANLPSFRSIKTLLEAGGQAPVQAQMELREADPIIRPLSAYTDFIASRPSGGDDSVPPQSTAPTTNQTTHKAS
jgi:hypothetical protein